MTDEGGFNKNAPKWLGPAIFGGSCVFAVWFFYWFATIVHH